jgi:hypothetical protein
MISSAEVFLNDFDKKKLAGNFHFLPGVYLDVLRAIRG